MCSAAFPSEPGRSSRGWHKRSNRVPLTRGRVASWCRVGNELSSDTERVVVEMVSFEGLYHMDLLERLLKQLLRVFSAGLLPSVTVGRPKFTTAAAATAVGGGLLGLLLPPGERTSITRPRGALWVVPNRMELWWVSCAWCV